MFFLKELALTEKQSREVDQVKSSLTMIVLIYKAQARLSNNTDPYEMPHSVQKRINRELCCLKDIHKILLIPNILTHLAYRVNGNKL